MPPTPIDNEHLRLADIPKESADWGEIIRFAQTFNGYEAHGSVADCAEITNARRHETLTDLRTCLFFEQRRHNHFGHDPDPETMAYLRSILAQIRARLSSPAS